jgi:hypothetical protein
MLVKVLTNRVAKRRSSLQHIFTPILVRICKFVHVLTLIYFLVTFFIFSLLHYLKNVHRQRLSYG